MAIPRTLRRRAAAAVRCCALLGLVVAGHADAGQVRVSAGQGGQVFVPYAVNVNLGDHVVWVWISGSHTVTNWNPPTDSLNATFDGTIFDSDPVNHFGTSNSRFSWKSDRTGQIPFVCVNHIPDMTGRIFVTDPSSSPKIAVSDFRISEVQYNIAAGQDLIEITNYGAAAGDLGRYRLAGGGAAVEIAVNSYPVPASGRVVVHANQAGTNTATDIFLPALGDLPDVQGSLALYVPNTISPGNALTNAKTLIDFVQWGSGAQANEGTAVTAGFWGSGTFVPTTAAGHSIEYCADVSLDHGVSRWAEIATPNFGSDGGCLTPTLNETWGRIKTLYRR